MPVRDEPDERQTATPGGEPRLRAASCPPKISETDRNKGLRYTSWRRVDVHTCATNVRQVCTWSAILPHPCASSPTSGSRRPGRGKSGLGLEAQRKAIDDFAASRGAQVIGALHRGRERAQERPAGTRQGADPARSSPARRW